MRDMGDMARAVRFDGYGDIDVLYVAEVQRQVPGPGQVLVAVRAAGINPGEASIRKGLFADRWPATFPSGQGSDLAGVVAELGDGVNGFAVGDEIIGYTDSRSSQAEFVLVEAEHLTAKPAGVPWPVAGSLNVAGSTAWAAVRAVALREGDTVVVSAAAGGVGGIAVQLARLAGARVIGLAGPANQDWLAGHGAVPLDYAPGPGPELAQRIRDAAGGRVDAFVDTFGGGYVEMAVGLGVAKDRIDTVADFPAVQRFGIKNDGNAVGAGARTLAELAALVDKGALEVPIARVYPLGEVREAYRDLERRHTRGKIVLDPTA
jgi:NADPH:quinone reductase-like Zn-dependent oxidoreductase